MNKEDDHRRRSNRIVLGIGLIVLNFGLLLMNLSKFGVLPAIGGGGDGPPAIDIDIDPDSGTNITAGILPTTDATTASSTPATALSTGATTLGG